MPRTIQAIRFGYVLEDIQRVLHDLIKKYFDGNQSQFADKSFSINNCEIVFGKQRLANEEIKPVIAILGERLSNGVDYKKIDKENIRNFAYEERTQVNRTVYIKLPLGYSGNDLNKSYRTAIRVWSLLHACFSAKHKALAQYGIDRPRLDTQPDESLSNNEYTVLKGNLSFQIRVEVKRDDY